MPRRTSPFDGILSSTPLSKCGEAQTQSYQQELGIAVVFQPFPSQSTSPLGSPAARFLLYILFPGCPSPISGVVLWGWPSKAGVPLGPLLSGLCPAPRTSAPPVSPQHISPDKAAFMTSPLDVHLDLKVQNGAWVTPHFCPLSSSPCCRRCLNT